jgi:hypothetical protein
MLLFYWSALGTICGEFKFYSDFIVSFWDRLVFRSSFSMFEGRGLRLNCCLLGFEETLLRFC